MSESLINTEVVVDILSPEPTVTVTPKKVELKVVLTKKEQRRADRVAQRQNKKG
jgi:hypothetical protein